MRITYKTIISSAIIPYNTNYTWSFFSPELFSQEFFLLVKFTVHISCCSFPYVFAVSHLFVYLQIRA